MSHADFADLDALQREITRTNIEAVASDDTRVDDLKRPEVVALMETTAVLCDALSERDKLRGDIAFADQQIAALQDRVAQLEATNTNVISQRDYWRTAFKGLQDTIEAGYRIHERGMAIIRQAYPERYVQKQAAMAMPDEPMPAIVTDRSNVHRLQGRPQRA